MGKSIVTPVGTLSYPHLAEPQKADQNGKQKYSCAIVFAPGTDLTALRVAALEAAEAKFGKAIKAGATSIPIARAMEIGTIRSPFRVDGEAKGYPAGSVFINVRSDNAPGCVYADLRPEKDKDEIKRNFYAGAQVRVSVSAFGYDSNGNKGVSFGLNNIQKIAEGERIDGRKSAEDEFTAELAEPGDLGALG